MSLQSADGSLMTPGNCVLKLQSPDVHHIAGVGIFSAGFSFVLVQIFPIMPDSFLWERGFWYRVALIV